MPFKKGQVANPHGRPKKEKEAAYAKAVQSECTLKEWREIIKVAVTQAKRGDEKARKWLSDNLVGLPVQKNEITGADGGIVKITVNLKNGEEL